MKGLLLILLVLLFFVSSQGQRITKPPSKPRPEQPAPVQVTKPTAAPVEKQNSTTVTPKTNGSGSGSTVKQNTTITEPKVPPKKEEPKPADGRTPFIFNGNEKEKPLASKKPVEPARPIIPTTLIPPVNFVPPSTCVKEKCCKFNFTTYHIYKYVKTRVEIPKYVYYTSSGDSVLTQVEYYGNYTSKVRTVRFLIDHLRLIIKELVTKDKLNVSLFHRSDKVLQNKKIGLEKLIQQKKITLGAVQGEISKLKKLLTTLKIDLQDPSACVFIGGKRRCGLVERQDLLTGDAKFYVKDRLFTTIYYVRVPTKISKISQTKSGFVKFVKKSSHWEKRTSRVHLKVKKTVLANVRKALLSNSRFKTAVDEEVKKQGKKPLSLRAIINMFLFGKFNKEYREAVRKELKSAQIMTMRAKFKDVVIKTTEEHAVETQEIVSLPKSLLKLGNKKLKEILVYKINIE